MSHRKVTNEVERSKLSLRLIKIPMDPDAVETGRAGIFSATTPIIADPDDEIARGYPISGQNKLNGENLNGISIDIIDSL